LAGPSGASSELRVERIRTEWSEVQILSPRPILSWAIAYLLEGGTIFAPGFRLPESTHVLPPFEYEDVGDGSFSADGKRSAFAAKRWRFVVDGFSPESERAGPSVA
jgi:hypothetical protein